MIQAVTVPESFMRTIHETPKWVIHTNQEWNGDNLGAVFGFCQYLTEHKIQWQLLIAEPIPLHLGFWIPGDFWNNTLAMEPQKPLESHIPQNHNVVTIGTLPESNKEIISDDSIMHLFVAYNTPLESNPNYYCTFPVTLSEMVYAIWQQAQLPITEHVANGLYCGIMAATRGFSAEKTSQYTHQIVARLLQITTVESNRVYQALFEQKPLNELCLLRRIAGSAQLFFQNRLTILQCSKEDLAFCECPQSKIYNIAEYPFVSKHIRIIMFLAETDRDNYTKVILYTKTPFDSLKILDDYNPFGDTFQAEAILPYKIEQSKKNILDKITPYFVS